MHWLLNTLGTSVGKKLMMAITGLGFIGFLTTHLAGNLMLYRGRDVFNAYADRLHSLGLLIPIFEMGLLALALIHVITGIVLFFENESARPAGYRMNKWAGGRTIGSATMPYTGLIILAFVVIHLFDFHFVDKTHTTIFEIVARSFANPVYVAIYVVGMVAVAVHVSHGFWSLFQTLGAAHPKYTPVIKLIGVAISLIFGIGFGFIPIYVSMFI